MYSIRQIYIRNAMHNRFPIEIGIILFPLLAAGQSRAAAAHLSSDVFPMETAPVALMKQYNTNMEKINLTSDLQ